MKLPCNPDHNGECLVCGAWLVNCPFSKGNKEEIKKIIETEMNDLSNKIGECIDRFQRARQEKLNYYDQLAYWTELKIYYYDRTTL